MNLEEAKRAFPGESLHQCDKCGHTASYGDAGPPGPTIHGGCGGTIRALPHKRSEREEKT